MHNQSVCCTEKRDFRGWLTESHFLIHKEFSSENTARRVLHIIQEEKIEMDRQSSAQDSSDDGDDSSPGFRELMKNFVMQGIAEMLDEIETASSHIASQALEHIHSK